MSNRVLLVRKGIEASVVSAADAVAAIATVMAALIADRARRKQMAPLNCRLRFRLTRPWHRLLNALSHWKRRLLSWHWHRLCRKATTKNLPRHK